MEPRRLRAVIYTRVSLDESGEGRSNDRQRGECLRLIDFKRWSLVEVDGAESVDDISISAYGEKERPGWERILRMIEAGEVDVVVAWHLDRLTRNMADLERLILLCEKHDVLVATATGDIDLTTDTGRMVARILAAVARQEVERKAARQRLAHVQRREEGKPWSSVKILGYDREGRIIEKEAEAIRQAMQDVINDRASLSELGRRWAEAGFVSSAHLRVDRDAEPDEQGKKPVVIKDMKKAWSPRGVKMLLTNPRIAGYITSSLSKDGKTAPRVIVGKGDWEPIVDETTFTLANAKLTDPGRFSGGQRAGRKPLNLLSGIMVCSKCGDTVRAGTSKVRMGEAKGRPAYVCNQWHVVAPREECDQLVLSAVAAVFATVAPGAATGGAEIPRADMEAIQEELGALRARQAVLTRSFSRGITPEADYEAAMTDIRQQMDALEQKAQRGSGDVDWQHIRAQAVRHFLQQPMSEQRAVLERVCEITLHPGSRWITTKDRLEVWVNGKGGGGRDLRIPALEPLRRGTQKGPHSAE